MTTSKTKTTNPLINTFLVFTVGLSALELSQLVFDPVNAASLTTLELDAVIDSMFKGMFLSADTLVSFMAVLVAWIISGMVAGVRAKQGFWGAFAAFFGTLLGAGLLLALNLNRLTEITIIIEFSIGTIACAIAASAAAYATGNATKIKPQAKKTLPTRKIWATSESKNVWKCNRCGNDIPPGVFSCPKCGEPVIE